MAKRETATGGRPATDAVVPGKAALSIGRPATLPEPTGFHWTALTQVAQLESGHTPSRARPEYWGGDIPWVGVRDATGNHGKVLSRTEQSVTQAGIDNSSARLLQAGTVCLSRTASVGYVVELGRPMATSQDFVNWVCGPKVHPPYLRYLFVSESDSVRRFAYGSVHATMYYPDAKALHVLLPALREQQAIAEVLGALDDKIAANTALATRAERLAATLVRSVPCREVELGELALFHNRRRIPLSASQRDARPGNVPYFGANGQLATVDEPLFDEPLVLLGEDGSVVRTDGTPYVHYIWGPAWVNNHAHVLTGGGISTELLATVLPLTKVDTLVTGAVQPKLSMGNAKRIRLTVPEGSHLAAVDRQVAALAASRRAADEESRTLAATRDALLPQLMSGKLRVRDAEKIAAEAGA